MIKVGYLLLESTALSGMFVLVGRGCQLLVKAFLNI